MLEKDFECSVIEKTDQEKSLLTGEVLRLANKMPSVEAKTAIRKIMLEKFNIKDSEEVQNQLVLSLS